MTHMTETQIPSFDFLVQTGLELAMIHLFQLFQVLGLQAWLHAQPVLTLKLGIYNILFFT